MEALHELLDGPFLAFDMRVDAAIGAIAHPAGHSKLLGLLTHPGAEKNALYAASHADMPSDPCHSPSNAGA